MPKVSIYNGKSKKTGKEYKAVLVEVGEWSGMLYPRTNFEMSYIEKKLKEEDRDGSRFNLEDED